MSAVGRWSLLLVGVGAMMGLAGQAYAQVILSETFDTVIPSGWTNINRSTTAGILPTWFQGTSTVFPAHQGADNSYAAANFNAVGGNGTISLWLITPSITVQNGDTVSFFTRTVTNPLFPDRLEVRFNAQNTTDVGSTDTSVGGFSDLLLSVNPDLTTTGYPDTWTQFTTTFSSLSGPTTGRLAFRYFVTNGGTGSNSDYIGIDTLIVSAAVPEPGALALLSITALPGAALLCRRRRTDSPASK